MTELTRTRPLLVAMGVSGSGKTTVAIALAERLGLPFVDADDLHPEANRVKMTAGRPLDDEDRFPWLQEVGSWLAEHRESGGVTSCSALRRTYRDQLRSHAPEAEFVHLTGSRALIEDRQRRRSGHFMPSSLMDSQFATLEPLEPDEDGCELDVDQTVDQIVDDYVRTCLAGRGVR